MRALPLSLAVAGCSSSSPVEMTPADASVVTPDAPTPADPLCVATFARVSDGLTPFGPKYGAFPAPSQPPVAFLSPGECIAIRIDPAAPDGLRIQMDGDRLTNWIATIQVDGGAVMPVSSTSVSETVVEGVVRVDNAPTYITMIAWPLRAPECTRNASLKRLADGSVAFVGYGGVDCGGGPR